MMHKIKKGKRKMSTVIFNGGLGNQLFQYVFMMYLEKENGVITKYNKSIYTLKNVHSGFQADAIFDFSHFKEDKRNYYNIFFRFLRKVSDNFFPCKKFLLCNENVFYDGIKTVAYDGFWQECKYYLAVKEELKKVCVDYSYLCRDKELKKLILGQESVFIHVRRGDYVKDNKYINLTDTDYYIKSINYIEKNVESPAYFVFSDDIEWCRNYFKEYTNFCFVEYKQQTALSDLGLMLMCKNAIVANSTFSWWGASLDTKRIVVRPNDYYSDKSGLSAKLYPSEWIAI